MWGRGLGMGDAVLGPRLPPHAAHRAGPVSSRPWEHRIARRHCPEPQTRHAADVARAGGSVCRSRNPVEGRSHSIPEETCMCYNARVSLHLLKKLSHER